MAYLETILLEGVFISMIETVGRFCRHPIFFNLIIYIITQMCLRTFQGICGTFREDIVRIYGILTFVVETLATIWKDKLKLLSLNCLKKRSVGRRFI